MKRTWILASIYFLITGFYPCTAQIVLSNLPVTTKWNQINTEKFRVVFPSDFRQGGNRVANTLQYLYNPVSESLNTSPRKISVVLQARNSLPNGFVTLGPRRSEFFTFSPQNYTFLGTNDWLDILAVHEFRHVVQFDKSRIGFTKLAYLALGEFAQAGMAFSAVPLWYWEGDAVGIETALTNSGRGRLPNFGMALRASFIEKGPFNYHKQYLGSFRDFVPNHYVLGYHFTTYLRKTNNNNIWDPILTDAFRKSFVPFTFSNSIKKHSGDYLIKTYNAFAESLTMTWKDQISDLSITNFERINNRKNNTFTNYNFPQSQPDGSVIAQKSGLSDIPVFVKVFSDGTEKKVFVPGIQNNPGYISTGGGLLVWTEFQFDPRWGERSYSIVKTYDLNTRVMRKITDKTRYSGATVSPDGKKIALVNNSPDGKINLMVITANLGNPMKSFHNENNNFYSMPRWSADGKYIVAIKHFFQSKEVVRIDFETETEQVLIKRSTENFGHPVLWNDLLFFNSDISGIDNIYAINIRTGERWQVTDSKFGAFNPSISEKGDKLYYSDFTVKGLDIVRIPVDLNSFEIFDGDNVPTPEFPQSLVDQEANPNILGSVPDEELPVSNYSSAGHLLNVHSWGPYFGTSITDFKIGVYSRDILSLNRGFLGYNYNVDENTGKWIMDYSFQGLLPIIDFEGSVGDRQTTEILLDSLDTQRSVTFNWKERGFKTGFRIPLELTNSKYRKGFTISNMVGYSRVTDFTNDYLQGIRFYKQQSNGNLLANEFILSFYSLLGTSKRDINSRWGQSVLFTSLSTPFGGKFDGGLTAIFGRLYFPGLFRHHSLNFLMAYQYQKITREQDNYWFSNRVPFPRGYSSTSWENFYTLRSNYEMTLWNADLALGPILNIQRIRTEIFFDNGYGDGTLIDSITGPEKKNDKNYWSTGAEIIFDFNFMRLLPIFEGGVRSVYTSERGLQFELVIGNIQI